MDFPKFNPEAPRSLRKSYFVNPNRILCKGIANAPADISCSLKEIPGAVATERLTISGAIPSGSSANVEMQIEIDSMFNPLSLSDRQFMTQLAVISKVDEQAYAIQEGFTHFAAREPTSISSVEISADETTVKEYAEYTVKFQPDVEIEAGAFVMIQFPLSNDLGQEVYGFDNNLNSMTTIGGLFGSRQDGVEFSTDRENLKIETKTGTQRYSTVSVATIIVSKIKNPSYTDTFKIFKISVFDKYKQLVAKVEQGLTF